MLSYMVAEEGGIDFVKSPRALGIVDDRHLATVLAQRKEYFLDYNGPHGWAYHLITLAVILRKHRRFLNDRKIIITTNQENQ